MIALFVAVGYLARRLEDWEVVALSSVFIVALFELTCYYYNFMVVLAPVAMARLRYLNVFLGLAVVTQLASLAVGWIDERYVVAPTRKGHRDANPDARARLDSPRALVVAGNIGVVVHGFVASFDSKSVIC